MSLSKRHVFFRCTVFPAESEVELTTGQGIESRKKAVFFKNQGKNGMSWSKRHVFFRCTVFPTEIEVELLGGYREPFFSLSTLFKAKKRVNKS